MNKIILALFVIGFWLFLPIPLMILDIGGFDTVTDAEGVVTSGETTGSDDFFPFLSDVKTFVRFYLNLLTFSIDGVTSTIRYFVRFLQFMSLIFVGVMLRGN